MLIFTERLPTEAPAAITGELRLDWDRRQRSRLRAQVSRGILAGTEVGIDLPRGRPLRHGDRLAAIGSDEVLRVVAATEQLLHVTAPDALALVRLAYHLGNRHVALQVGQDASGGWLRLPLDHVLSNMVEGLGGQAVVLSAPFDPESGAYAGGHAHADDAADRRHAPRIHDFTDDAP